MGVVATITATTFPTQGDLLGQRVSLCFHYDSDTLLPAVCLRDDMEAPYRTIFQLDDGRVVLASECQYTLSPTLEEHRNERPPRENHT